MATDREVFWRMLAGADSLHDYQQLSVRQPDERRIVIETGPDDAAAVFGFGPDGQLKTVSVVEAHPDMEVECDGN